MVEYVLSTYYYLGKGRDKFNKWADMFLNLDNLFEQV